MQLELLGRVEELPPLSAKEAKRWRKDLLELAGERREVEKKGRNYWWEDEKRGLYIVGGQTRKPKGLLISMHGGGVGQGDAGPAHSTYTSVAKKRKWVSISPQVLEKTEHGWTTAGTEEWIVELIESALRTWKIDPNRVYLAGHSMGGYGSWTLGGHHADRIAAIAPSAGAPTPIRGADGMSIGVDDGVIPNLRNVRVAIYQSDDDPNVPPDANRAAVTELEKAKERWGGFDFDYWEVEGRGHDMPPGGVGKLLEKIEDSERNPVPERVVWQMVLPWKRQFYWLYTESPFPRTTVVADLDREANAIDIQVVGGLRDLSVLLDDRLVDMEREVVVRVDGTERFRGVPERSLAALLLTADGGDAELVFDSRVRVTP